MKCDFIILRFALFSPIIFHLEAAIILFLLILFDKYFNYRFKVFNY